MKIVIDASALFDYLLHPDEAPGIDAILQTVGTELHTPELTDIEIASAFRSAMLGKGLTESRVRTALDDYLRLPLTRHRHRPFLHRLLELRHNFSAYDATYIALAEELGASLMTTDVSLARAVRSHLKLPVLP